MFSANDAKELMYAAKTAEFEKELQDILQEVKINAAKGSGSLTTWISKKAITYVLQNLHDLGFRTVKVDDEDNWDRSRDLYTISWE